MVGGTAGAARRGRGAVLSAILMATTAAGWIAAMPAAAQTASEARRGFDIPAQPLAQALMLFGRQSGLQVTAEGPLTDGLSSTPVAGDLSPAEALSRLLTGTGLTFRFVGGNGVQLERAPQAGGDTIQLGPVRVAGDSAKTGIAASITSDPAATENTGSYTTHAMGTATKMPLSIRETPQAVTVITRQRLDDLAVTNIVDVVRYTPGLFLSVEGSGRNAFRARGFQVDSIMFDGIPAKSIVGSAYGTQANMAIFDRVEVVRGATGLVTGSGDPSAAINLVRKRPTRHFQARLEGAAGSWENYRGEVDLSSGIAADGALRVRVVGSYRDSGTFRDDEVVDRGIIYGVVEYDVTPDTTVMAGYSHQDDLYNQFWGGLPISERGEHLNLPRSTRSSFNWEKKADKTDTLFGEISHDFGDGWRVRLAGMKMWQEEFFSGTTIVRRDGALRHQAYHSGDRTVQYGLDAVVSGPVTLMGRSHDVTVGASRRGHRARWANYTGYELLPGAVDIFDFDPASGTRPDFEFLGHSDGGGTTQNGLYASVRLNPADWAKIILGGRLDWLKNDD